MVCVISYHVTGKTKVASLSLQVTTFRELQHLMHLTNHRELVISRFMKLFHDPLGVAHDRNLVENHCLSSYSFRLLLSLFRSESKAGFCGDMQSVYVYVPSSTDFHAI